MSLDYTGVCIICLSLTHKRALAIDRSVDGCMPSKTLLQSRTEVGKALDRLRVETWTPERSNHFHSSFYSPFPMSNVCLATIQSPPWTILLQYVSWYLLLTKTMSQIDILSRLCKSGPLSLSSAIPIPHEPRYIISLSSIPLLKNTATVNQIWYHTCRAQTTISGYPPCDALHKLSVSGHAVPDLISKRDQKRQAKA